MAPSIPSLLHLHLIGKHMEEDEKEIKIHVGGDKEAGRRREKSREKTEQYTTQFYFSCLFFSKVGKKE